MKQAFIFTFIFFYFCSHKEVVYFESPEQLNAGIQTASLKDEGINEELNF